MLDNTSVLALGVVLAPVTWLFGPVATLNVALTAAPALSAISAYGCLRRGLGLWQPAVFVAGLLFGFSPFVQRNQTLAHLQVTFLALVPLIFLCAYELIVAQRGKWWRWGLILGVLVGIQFFIGSEILTMTTLTVAGSAVLVLICAAVARRNVLRKSCRSRCAASCWQPSSRERSSPTRCTSPSPGPTTSPGPTGRR